MADLTTTGRLQLAEELTGLPAAVLGVLLTAASAAVEQHCGRVFAPMAVANELYDGDGLNQLLLCRTPVATIVTVDIREPDDTWTTITETVPATKFYFKADTGEVRISPNAGEDYSYFPTGFQNVRATYTGGYATGAAAEHIQQAVIHTAVWLHQHAAQGGQVLREKLGDYEIGIKAAAAKGLPAEAILLLARERRYEIRV